VKEQRLKNAESVPPATGSDLAESSHVTQPGRGGPNGRLGRDEQRRLVEGCRAGDRAAWKELYGRLHKELLAGIRHIVAPNGGDASFAEDVAAHVWYVLWRDRVKILGRFDGERNGSFAAFLLGVARLEAKQQMRSRRRRRGRELGSGARMIGSGGVSGLETGMLLNEFAATLSARELEFLEEYLLSVAGPNGGGGGRPLSGVNVRQMRHRLRQKLLAFLDEP